ncbi:hypothetical protein [Clostridium tagluense]|nr:hypothetical protein [Clostridium tagluense]
MTETKPFNISKRAVLQLMRKLKQTKERMELMNSQSKILKRI